MGRFPSGQRGQTVNLLQFASVVRIRPSPPIEKGYPDGYPFSIGGTKFAIMASEVANSSEVTA